MIHLTRRQIQETVRLGDVVCVTYRQTNGVAKILRWAEAGRASHAIECLGGLDTVEETIGGGMRTNLYTYLRGQCDLEVKRVPGPAITYDEGIRLESYWLSLVGKGYGWDSIRRAAVTVPIRRFIRPHFPRLARWLTGIARFLHAGKMPDCSAAWVDGIRIVRPDVLRGYAPEEVTPETILRDTHLVTVARWEAPVLDEGVA